MARISPVIMERLSEASKRGIQSAEHRRMLHSEYGYADPYLHPVGRYDVVDEVHSGPASKNAKYLPIVKDYAGKGLSSRAMSRMPTHSIPGSAKLRSYQRETVRAALASADYSDIEARAVARVDSMTYGTVYKDD